MQTHALARIAATALKREARLTPKPGLVDARGSGPHTDMDLSLLLASAETLEPFFAEIAEAAGSLPWGVALREEIGALGRRADAAMLADTGGVNTHRGALWALGLLVAGAASARSNEAHDIASRAGFLARLPDRFACQQTTSHGRLVARRYGTTGARGEAQAGFPHVVRVALPLLRGLEASEVDRQLGALLASMSRLADTCVLYRGGRRGLRLVQDGARRVLAAGGATHPAGRRELAALDVELCAARLSPSGSADVLSAALFLETLGAYEERSDRRDPGAVPCRS
ncbi:MAG TPA: triphosphoribosyl-dephospho-CoA synthase [Solirubrobacteraceae bacterium]